MMGVDGEMGVDCEAGVDGETGVDCEAGDGETGVDCVEIIFGLAVDLTTRFCLFLSFLC